MIADWLDSVQKIASPWLAPAILVFGTMACTTLSAHPQHESIAEAEWNHKTGKLEVAMRLRPEDLESALTRMLGSSKRVNLDSTSDVDKHLQAYLQARFTLKADGAKRRQPFTWIGKEVDLRYAWVYFEITMPAKDAAKAALSSTVLMDLLPDQVNTIVLQDGKQQTSLQFSRLQPVQRPWRTQAPE